MKCKKTIYIRPPSCRNLFKNTSIKNGEKITSRTVTDIYKNHFDAWMCHPLRRTYKHGVVFDPGGVDDPHVYNLWSGYSIEPLDGECEVILNFILDVICAGNKKHYQYVLNWLARAIQRPQDIGEVALVLRGKKGCGKRHWVRLCGLFLVITIC